MIMNIRDIQHYMYCPRRFALLKTDYSWQENVFTIISDIIHERVHTGKHKIHSNSKYELSDIYVYNDFYNILGKVDCLELKKNASGVYINEFKDKFDVNIIEYKPTKPKNKNYNSTDAIQVYAQKLCVDYIFKCDSNMFIYYSDVKRRFEIDRNENYQSYIDEYLDKMRYITENAIIPNVLPKQKCSGCSIIDICMPKVKSVNIKETIKNIVSREE